MTPEQIVEIGSKLAELPLHALLLIAVVVLWLDLRKTRQALDDCLTNSTLNAQRINALESHIQEWGDLSQS